MSELSDVHYEYHGTRGPNHAWKFTHRSECFCEVGNNHYAPTVHELRLLAAANAYMHYTPPYDSLEEFSEQFVLDIHAAILAADRSGNDMTHPEGYYSTAVDEEEIEQAHTPTLNERIVRAVSNQRPWFIEKADDVLHRIKTDTTEDVMLYHDAVSVLVAAKAMYELVAGAEIAKQAHTPTDDERIVRASIHGDTDAIRALNRLLRRTVQGEPTDAQVIAGAKAAVEVLYVSSDVEEWVRAALRAAASVGN